MLNLRASVASLTRGSNPLFALHFFSILYLVEKAKMLNLRASVASLTRGSPRKIHLLKIFGFVFVLLEAFCSPTTVAGL